MKLSAITNIITSPATGDTYYAIRSGTSYKIAYSAFVSGILSELGVTASVAEINFVDGVTSAIQTQINSAVADIATNTADIAANTADIATNTADIATMSVATGAEVNTGTDNAKRVTPKALADSNVVITDKAQTLTNKRITKRILSATSYTTDTGTSLNCDNLDEFIVTAQAGALLFNNPTGTPTDGQLLLIAVTGTAARALTYGNQFEASTVALPTTTVTTARLNMLFIWRADTSKWVILASS